MVLGSPGFQKAWHLCNPWCFFVLTLTKLTSCYLSKVRKTESRKRASDAAQSFLYKTSMFLEADLGLVQKKRHVFPCFSMFFHVSSMFCSSFFHVVFSLPVFLGFWGFGSTDRPTFAPLVHLADLPFNPGGYIQTASDCALHNKVRKKQGSNGFGPEVSGYCRLSYPTVSNQTLGFCPCQEPTCFGLSFPLPLVRFFLVAFAYHRSQGTDGNRFFAFALLVGWVLKKH